MLKKNFELNNGIKMVLFVPLKCEKYLHEGKMPLVYKKVRKAYETTFNYLDGNNKQKCIVAVTPIITFGCAEFQRFERDENYNIILDENYHLPKKALYIFTDTQCTEPQSQYCEQPMVYILAYVFEMARRLKENKANSSGFFSKFINWFEESFLDMPSADDYLLELDNVKKYIIDSAYNEDFGARPIKRFIQNEIETFLAKEILANKINTVDSYLLDYEDGALVLKKQ